MPRKQPQRQSAAVGNAEERYIARRTARHLEDLEKSNYRDAGISGDSVTELAQRRKEAEEEAAAAGSRKRITGTNAVKLLLIYRKPLETLIQESNPSLHHYLSAAAPPSSKPPVHLCSICGYRGVYACTRCALRYCSLACRTTHDEMRCERRGH